MVFWKSMVETSVSAVAFYDFFLFLIFFLLFYAKLIKHIILSRRIVFFYIFFLFCLFLFGYRCDDLLAEFAGLSDRHLVFSLS
jgi:hypothetical protein